MHQSHAEAEMTKALDKFFGSTPKLAKTPLIERMVSFVEPVTNKTPLHYYIEKE